MDETGVVQMSLRLWMVDDEDQNTTQMQTADDDSQGLAALSVLSFAEVQELFASGQWGPSLLRRLPAVMVRPRSNSWKVNGQSRGARRRSQPGYDSWTLLPSGQPWCGLVGCTRTFMTALQSGSRGASRMWMWSRLMVQRFSSGFVELGRSI